MLVRSSSGSITHSARTRPNDRLLKVLFTACWLESYLQIVTKDRKVQFLSFNPFQWILLQYIAFCALHDLPVQIVVPKGRQGGVSTFCQAWNFANAVLNDRKGLGFRAVTIAHTEESALTLFRMSSIFERRLAEEWTAELDTKQKGHFEWPNAGASVSVATIKSGDALGRGSTLNSIHGSEVGSWSDMGADASHAWTAVMGALSDSPDSMVVLESTPKGRDPFFFRTVDDALKGLNTFKVIFLPWYLCPDYRMKWSEYRRQRLALGWDEDRLPEKFQINEEEVKLRDDVAGQVVKPGEEWHRHRVLLDEDQLVWRRHTIEKKCDAKLGESREAVFKREYPSTLEECWTATSQILVSGETMEYYYANARDPEFVGEVVRHGGGGVRWADRKEGDVRVWTKPQRGRKYVIGADVADGNEGGDGQAAYVLDKASAEVVAAIYAQVESDLYAEKLCALGYYYNTAHLAIENNYDPSCAKRARELHYPNLYYYVDVTGGQPKLGSNPKAGWNTNRNTRQIMTTTLRAMLRDRDLAWFDQEGVLELGTFTWHSPGGNDKRGRYQAQHGKKDDRVMALCISVCLTGKRDAAGRRREVSSAQTEAHSEAYEQFLREQEREERTSSGGPIYL